MNVLIADDDALIRMDLRTVLEELGHSVVAEAAGGYEAIRLARQVRPSVAILDVRMPNGSGLEAASAMSRERLCPVVLLTAYSEAPLVEEANKAGVLAYLVKPFSERELMPTLEVAIARFRELLAVETELESLAEKRAAEDAVQRAAACLSRQHTISRAEALRRMEARRVSSGKSLREVAEAILLIAGINTPTTG